jgi:hypothetical protein
MNKPTRNKHPLFNPLNANLNPICHFLALLGSHPILHVSRIRVKIANDTLVDLSINQRLMKLWTTIRNLPSFWKFVSLVENLKVVSAVWVTTRGKLVMLSALHTDRLYPPLYITVLISIRGWVDMKPVVRPERLSKLKITVTPSKIESATFWLVAQTCTKCTTACPCYSVIGI